MPFSRSISTRGDGRFLVLPRRTPNAEQVNASQAVAHVSSRASGSTEATTLRGLGRPAGRAVNSAEAQGGPGVAGTLRGRQGGAHKARGAGAGPGPPRPQSVAPRPRPAAPFPHPQPFPTPTARGVPSLPSPRLRQPRPAERPPPGRGARGRARPPPWASRQPCAPGTADPSLSPCPRRRPTTGRKPRSTRGTGCRKLVRRSSGPAETRAAVAGIRDPSRAGREAPESSGAGPQRGGADVGGAGPRSSSRLWLRPASRGRCG